MRYKKINLKELHGRINYGDRKVFIRCISDDKKFYTDIPVPNHSDTNLRKCLLKNANNYYNSFFDNDYKEINFTYYHFIDIINGEFVAIEDHGVDDSFIGMDMDGNIIYVDGDTFEILRYENNNKPNNNTDKAV